MYTSIMCNIQTHLGSLKKFPAFCSLQIHMNIFSIGITSKFPSFIQLISSKDKMSLATFLTSDLVKTGLYASKMIYDDL